MSTEQPPFRVYMKIPLSIYSGYGQDGLGMVRALQAMGADIYLEPSHVAAPVPEDILPLLAKPVQAPFDLAIIHVDPMILKATETLKQNAKVVVGWTMWEYDSMLNLPTLTDPVSAVHERLSFARGIARDTGQKLVTSKTLVAGLEKEARDEAAQTFRDNLKWFDVLVGYDDNTVNGFKPFFDGPIIKVQGGYHPDDWKPLIRDWTSPEFRFCQIGQLSERKDPFKTIEAFVAAKHEDAEFNRWARLSLKTTAPAIHSAVEDMLGDEQPDGTFKEVAEDGTLFTSIRVFYEIWPHETILDFYSANHVLVAPSRGEGKNMPALEFLSTGGTVIATDWGGHQGWLSEEYAYPLNYTLEPSEPGSPAKNARADVEHLKELMLDAFHNRNEAQRRGEVGSQVIPLMCSWEVVMERLFYGVSEVLPDSGLREIAQQRRAHDEQA